VRRRPAARVEGEREEEERSNAGKRPRAAGREANAGPDASSRTEARGSGAGSRARGERREARLPGLHPALDDVEGVPQDRAHEAGPRARGDLIQSAHPGGKARSTANRRRSLDARFGSASFARRVEARARRNARTKTSASGARRARAERRGLTRSRRARRARRLRWKRTVNIRRRETARRRQSVRDVRAGRVDSTISPPGGGVHTGFARPQRRSLPRFCSWGFAFARSHAPRAIAAPRVARTSALVPPSASSPGASVAASPRRRRCRRARATNRSWTSR
jgi:hypothetical protein